MMLLYALLKISLIYSTCNYTILSEVKKSLLNMLRFRRMEDIAGMIVPPIVLKPYFYSN